MKKSNEQKLKQVVKREKLCGGRAGNGVASVYVEGRGEAVCSNDASSLAETTTTANEQKN